MTNPNPVILVLLGDLQGAFYCETQAEAQRLRDTSVSASLAIIISPDTAAKVASGELKEIEL